MQYLASISDAQRDLVSTQTALKAASKLSSQFGVDADALQARKYATVSTTKLRRYQSAIEKFLGPAHREVVKSLNIHEPLDVCNLVAETFMQNVMMLIDIAENRK
ncbi:hypothetical protein AAVH_36315 [Aphelenchoides avenae]|nr:hypothetical protein AAVH_36315 [Aphelenchus avenae]